MAFQIVPIDGLKPENGKVYLFDSNVWINVLMAPPKISDYEKLYINFFQAVFEAGNNFENKNPPKIYISNPLLSEIFNACMRIHMDTFNENEPVDKTVKEYRATHHCKTARKNLISDIKIYENCFIIEDSTTENCITSLLSIPEFCDFNDYHYYLTSKSKKMTLVTMDGDFKFEDVEIITGHSKLLKLIPKK